MQGAAYAPSNKNMSAVAHSPTQRAIDCLDRFLRRLAARSWSDTAPRALLDHVEIAGLVNDAPEDSNVDVAASAVCWPSVFFGPVRSPGRFDYPMRSHRLRQPRNLPRHARRASYRLLQNHARRLRLERPHRRLLVALLPRPKR